MGFDSAFKGLKHFVFTNFFGKSCLFWDNTEKYCRAGQATVDNIIRRMRFACWITTDTHSEYVIRTAIPLRQWLPERASIVRYMYIGWLANCSLLPLAPWSRVLLSFRVTIRPSIQEISAVRKILMFIAVSTTARYWLMLWATWIETTPSCSVSF